MAQGASACLRQTGAHKGAEIKGRAYRLKTNAAPQSFDSSSGFDAGAVAKLRRYKF